MYLHLIHADPKFPKLIRKFFEAALPGEHVYVIIGGSEDDATGEDFHGVRNAAELAAIVNAQVRWDGVFLNGLLEAGEPFEEVLPVGVKVAWVIWGYEIYAHLYPYSRGIREPQSDRFFRKTALIRLKVAAGSVLWPFRRSERRTRRVLSSVDYVVCHIREEYELIKKRGFLANSQQWFNAPVLLLSDLIDSDSAAETVTGANILVGNSATSSNNHVDVFLRLAKYDLSGRKVIVPLSYGSASYRRFVLEQGERLLGDAFEPILDFLPLDEYLNKMNSCSVVIMNHYRQQAVGNVLAAIWGGARVYLGPSTVLSGYRRLGLPVYSFQNEFEIELAPVDRSELFSVREKLQQLLGDDVVCAQLRQLLLEMKAPGVAAFKYTRKDDSVDPFGA